MSPSRQADVPETYTAYTYYVYNIYDHAFVVVNIQIQFLLFKPTRD